MMSLQWSSIAPEYLRVAVYRNKRRHRRRHRARNFGLALRLSKEIRITTRMTSVKLRGGKLHNNAYCFLPECAMCPRLIALMFEAPHGS